MIDFLSYDLRPEGGAVKFTALLGDGHKELRILRTSIGVVPNSPTETGHTVVYDGQLLPCVADLRRLHLVDEVTPLVGANRDQGYFLDRAGDIGVVWDLQAYSNAFEDAPNLIDGEAWSYHFWSRDNSNNYSQRYSFDLTPQRTVEASLDLDVKTFLYYRLQYHCIPKNIFASKEEAVHTSKNPPLAILKTRLNLIQRNIGDYEEDGDTVTAVRYRAVSDIMLIATEPLERDNLGNYLHDRLLGDVELIELFGLQGVDYSTLDSMMDVNDDMWYTKEITLSGELEGHIRRKPLYPINNVQFPS